MRPNRLLEALGHRLCWVLFPSLFVVPWPLRLQVLMANMLQCHTPHHVAAYGPNNGTNMLLTSIISLKLDKSSLHKDMENYILKSKILVLAYMLPCICIMSCKRSDAWSRNPDKENLVSARECDVDTLESDVLCSCVGDYTVLDFSYVSPSTAKRYAYDFNGRKVFEDGVTFSGAYSFAAWDYNEDGSPKTIYWSDSDEPGAHGDSGNDDGLSMLVRTLTGFVITDRAVEKFIFEYHPTGHIRRIYNPDNNHEITCPSGGEIIFRVYQMDGDSSSELIGNDALNIEFRVMKPQNGAWREMLYLGYRQIAEFMHQE